MQDDLLNILSNNNKDIDNQKMIDYINGKLSEEQKHEVEKWMADNPLFNDGIEGLQQAGSARSATAVEQINRQLRLHLQQRRRKKEPVFISSNLWIYVAVLLIIILVVVGYLLIKLKT